MESLAAFAFFFCLGALAVGLVRPSLVRCPSRKSVGIRFGIAAFGLALFGSSLAPPPDVPEGNAYADVVVAEDPLAAPQQEPNAEALYQPEAMENSLAGATSVLEGGGPVSEAGSGEAAVDGAGAAAVEHAGSVSAGAAGKVLPPHLLVVDVVDGDTVKVSIDGKVETLRLIGIDTPETKDPRKPVQCFGNEASTKAAELLSGRQVRLESDPTQGDRDKYGRLLRYLWREDGVFFNEWMIRNGYAHEYTYDLPYVHQARFKSAERYASDNKLGLWNPAACAGDTSAPAESPAATASLGGHTFYTSSHHSAQFYYCDTDPGWEGLSKSYLKSFTSEGTLLASYPSRTLHEPCK